MSLSVRMKPILWAENSVTYNGSAGTQSVTIEGDNCAADQTLNITVTPEPTPVVTNVTICSDEILYMDGKQCDL